VALYAYGLGATTPAVKTGSASPNPPATSSAPYQIICSYLGAAPITESPEFAGLTPGYVGLYQINFKVAAPPAGTVPCGSAVLGGNNLTVTISNQPGYEPAQGFYADPLASDTFSICVNP
jgi:uncharacterized protein (TIGR03437 family)